MARTLPLEPHPAEALLREHRLHGVRSDGWTAGGRWEHEADVPDAVRFRAVEALQGGLGR